MWIHRVKLRLWLFCTSDQFKVPEAHSEIFITFLKSSVVVGWLCVFCYCFFSPNCCNRDAEISFKVTAVAPRYVFYLVMGITCKIFEIPGLKAYWASFMSSWKEKFLIVGSILKVYIDNKFNFFVSVSLVSWGPSFLMVTPKARDYLKTKKKSSKRINPIVSGHKW